MDSIQLGPDDQIDQAQLVATFRATRREPLIDDVLLLTEAISILQIKQKPIKRWRAQSAAEAESATADGLDETAVAVANETAAASEITACEVEPCQLLATSEEVSELTGGVAVPVSPDEEEVERPGLTMSALTI